MCRLSNLFGVVVLCSCALRLVANPPLPDATQNLMKGKPDLRVMMFATTPRAFYGQPFYSAATADQAASGFLGQHQDAFGFSGISLVQQSAMNTINDRYRVFVYRQALPNAGASCQSSADCPGGVCSNNVCGDFVEASRVVVVVRIASPNEVVFASAFGLIPVPDPPLAGDAYTAAQAIAAVQADPDYDHLTFQGATAAKRVVFLDSAGVSHRVWTFVGYDADEEWRFYVDTATNSLLQASDQRIFFDTDVTVRGEASPCCSAPELSCPAALTTLPRAQLNVMGSSPQTVYADDAGFRAFTGLTAPDDIQAKLIGLCRGSGSQACVTVHDGTISDPVASLTVDASEGSLFVDFDETNCSTPSTTELVNGFYWVQKAHDWVRDWAPNLTAIDVDVAVEVGLPALCNAGFSEVQGPRLSFGAACNDFEFCPGLTARSFASSSIIAHEYGHFVLYQFGHLAGGSFGESFADILAGLMLKTECLGQGLCTQNADTACVRNLDTDTGSFFRPAYAFWDTREAMVTAYGESSAEQKINTLFGTFMHVVSPIPGVGSGQSATDEALLLAEVLVADDDDGRICNGTPHSAQILSAFRDTHGFSDPCCPDAAATTTVRWLGPSGNPSLGQDYFVYNVAQRNVLTNPDSLNCVPQVILETAVGGNPAADVREYRIGRVVGGVPATVDVVGTNWSGTATEPGVRIRLGIQDDLLLDMDDVGSAEIVPQTGKWSTLILDLAGDVTEFAEAFGVAGDGGRVSGSVDGTVKKIEAEAIGTEANGAGSLAIGKLLVGGELRVGTHPTNASLRVGGGGSSGGNIVSTTALFDGPIQVTEAFTGKLCAPGIDITAPIQLPGGIDVAFASTGKVCDDPQTSCANCAVPCSSPLAVPPAEPTPIQKNRFISFKVPADSGSALYALRVRLDSLHRPENPVAEPPDFSAFEGQFRYVNVFAGTPENPDLDCVDSTAQSTSFKCAKLGCDPQYVDWDAALGTDVLHVTGPEIVPDSVYSVQAVRQPLSGEYACPSAALIVTTGRWGDVSSSAGDPDGQTNVIDISAVVNKIKELPGSGSEPQMWLKFHNPVPRGDAVNVLDLSAVVDAVKEMPYPSEFTPCACPSLASCDNAGCPGTPCEIGFECQTQSGVCLDACLRCTE